MATPPTAGWAGGIRSCDARRVRSRRSRTGARHVRCERFIFPDSSERLLTGADLDGLDAAALGFARNEIFARNGNLFRKDVYVEHYSSYQWNREMPNKRYDIMPEDVSDLDRTNVRLIQEREARLGQARQTRIRKGVVACSVPPFRVRGHAPAEESTKRSPQHGKTQCCGPFSRKCGVPVPEDGKGAVKWPEPPGRTTQQGQQVKKENPPGTSNAIENHGACLETAGLLPSRPRGRRSRNAAAKWICGSSSSGIRSLFSVCLLYTA